MVTEFKHQGSIAEKSTAQKLNQGVSRPASCGMLNIIRGGLFLVLFWTSKKVQKTVFKEYGIFM